MCNIIEESLPCIVAEEPIPIEKGSDQLADESYTKVRIFLDKNNRDFKLADLIANIDKNLIDNISRMLDIRTGMDIQAIVKDSDLEESSFQLDSDIKTLNTKVQVLVYITMIKKILDNKRYLPETISEKHIRDNIYLKLSEYSSDLSYIWLCSVRKKLQKGKNNI